MTDVRPIDADALVSYLQKMAETYHLMEKEAPQEFKSIIYGKFTAIMEVLLHVKRNAPTLDYAPVRHARWVKDKDDLFCGNHFIHQRCSLCGGEAHINRFGTAYILSDFCPNCCAKMDGGREA